MRRGSHTVLAVLPVALLAVISAPRQIDAAEYHATTSVTQAFEFVNVTTPAGDHVPLAGEVHLLARAAIFEDGAAYVALYATLVGVSGTGESGTAYRATGAAFTELITADGIPTFPVIWDADFRLQPVGPSAQPTEPIRVNLTLTFSATDPGRLTGVEVGEIWIP